MWSDAFAQAGGGAGQSNPGLGMLLTLLQFVPIFLIRYFLLIRPQQQQQKAHEKMVKSLSKGDEIVTLGGIVGKIVHLTDEIVTIRTAQDTRLEIERAKVGRRIEGGDGSS